MSARNRLPLFPKFRVLNPLWPEFLFRRMSDDDYVASLRAELELAGRARGPLFVVHGILAVLTFLALMQVDAAVWALVLNPAAENVAAALILGSMTGTLAGTFSGIIATGLGTIPRSIRLLVRYADAAGDEPQPSARAPGWRRFLPTLVLSRSTETDAEFIARMRNKLGIDRRLRPWLPLAVIPLLGTMAYIACYAMMPPFRHFFPNNPDTEFWLWFTVTAVFGPLSLGLVCWIVGNLLALLPGERHRTARLLVQYYDEAHC